MTKPSLATQWKITEELLLRASSLLIGPRDEASDSGFVRIKTEAHEYLAHNEFELALDMFEELGHATDASRQFWTDLSAAAQNMDLRDRVDELRNQMRTAPDFQPIEAEQDGGGNSAALRASP
jgi:plasmid maintenance system antidote protein VapI